MSVSDLQRRVRSAAAPDMTITNTKDGCIVQRGGRAIEFWVDSDDDPDRFVYTRLVDGKPDRLGDLHSDDVSDALQYL